MNSWGRTIIDLSCMYQVSLEDGRRFSASLPGTLEENKIGDADYRTIPTLWH